MGPMPASGLPFAACRPACAPMLLPSDDWARLIPHVKAACPRLTDLDLREAQNRLDLLAAKIQNRHWISHEAARRTITAALQAAGVKA